MPLDIAWCDCEKNLMNVASKLHTIRPDTDILVLPEMFTSGFIQDPDLLDKVSSYADATLAAVKGWSERFNMAITGSYQVKENGMTFNRAFFVEPSGETTFYDKRHLFCLSPESKLFSPGEELPPVIRFRGWNIAMIVCYDLRFPVWCRNFRHRYDMLIVPANWPSSRGYAWEHLLIARAIENQAVVVGADRSGHDDYGNYDGMAYIFDALGRKTASSAAIDSNTPSDSKTSQNFENYIYAEFSKDQLDKMRMKLPVINDADDFSIECSSKH